MGSLATLELLQQLREVSTKTALADFFERLHLAEAGHAESINYQETSVYDALMKKPEDRG